MSKAHKNAYNQMLELSDDDLICMIKAEKKRVGIYGNFIQGYNDFLDNGIKDIIVNAFIIEQEFPPNKDGSQPDIEKFWFKIDIKDVRVIPPKIVDYNKSTKIPLYPVQARLQNLTYAGQIYIDAVINIKAYIMDGSVKTRQHTINNFPLAQIPIMLMCKYCNLYNKTREELINLSEDPNMHGGAFIINGVEWAVATIENTTFNIPRIFKQKNYKTESVRADLISKLGDGYENSSALKVIRHTDGQIVCHITSVLATDYIIPFYMIFRAFGASNDKEIRDYITYDDVAGGDTTITLDKLINQAFNAKYKKFTNAKNVRDPVEVINLLSEEFFPTSNVWSDAQVKQNTIKAIHNKTYKILDEKCIPHIGKTEHARSRKMQYLGSIIRKLLLVDMGVIESTDRDTYAFKRLHGPGPSIAKAFKQHYNMSVVKKIKSHFVIQLHKYNIETIAVGDIFENAVNSADFEKSIAKAISSGTDSEVKMGSTSITNRLRTKQLAPQNHLHLLSIISNIESTSASAVQSGSERSEEMRSYHSSSIGYLCPVQTPVGGKNVGIVKQPAYSTYITLSSPGHLLENRILEDSDVIPYADIKPIDIPKYYPLTTIYVNGRPVGYTQDTLKFVERYRNMRRRQEIDVFITIYWNMNTNEVEFWTDYGRVVRPILKVYNNADDITYKKNKKGDIVASAEFYQYLKYTKQDAYDLHYGKITMMDLLERGILEYISAEEQKNCLIAQSIDQLMADQDPESPPIKYTHCEVPQGLIGVPILTSPFGNYNYLTKLILQGSQSRQTNGYIFNYPYRVDKSMYLQHYNEIPLVRTIAYDHTPPNGINIVIAILVSNGYNQEDSLVANKGAIDRGLFECSSYSYSKVDLARGDKARKPDPTTTMDMKAHANYDKLTEYGYPAAGTLINKGDVIIGKITPIQKKSDYKDKYSWVDNSVIYNEDEPVIIENVITDRDGNDQYFIKVQMRSVRPVITGDKFSSRSGQKGVIGLVDRESSMPFTANGVVPDLLFNCHGMITRKTMSMIMEIVVSKYCAITGTVMDGTIFKSIDMEGIQKELEKRHLNGDCTETLYNGITGEPMDARVFIGINFYQRLQKFPGDALQSIARGPSDARYRQPVRGKNSGKKIGEMEANVLYGNGCNRFIEEKMSKHSDGMIDYYCRNCSSRAITNHNYSLYDCPVCKDAVNLVGVRTSWTSKLMLQNMRAAGIGSQLQFEEPTYIE